MAASAQRIGVIGDVHTETESLEAALGWLRAAEVDLILCVGDVADGAGDGDEVLRCCELLSADDVHTVCGNHDRWLCASEMRDLHDATDPDDVEPEAMAFLEALPPTLSFETPRGSLLLCHATGSNDMRGVKPFDRGPELAANLELQRILADGTHRLLVAGHTHMRMVREVQGLTLINAGTLHPRSTPCFCVIDLDAGQVDFQGFDGDGAIVPLESLPLP